MLIHSSKKILKHTKHTTSQVIHLTLSINAPIQPFRCLREDMLIHSSKKILKHTTSQVIHLTLSINASCVLHTCVLAASSTTKNG